MNQPNNPGLPCPQCGHLIKFTIQGLLYDAQFICPICGLSLTINRERSKETLGHVENLHIAMENLEKAKKFSR